MDLKLTKFLCNVTACVCIKTTLYRNDWFPWKHPAALFPLKFQQFNKEVVSWLSSSFCHLHVIKCYGTYVQMAKSQLHVSQAVLQMLQTKHMNFEKMLG